MNEILALGERYGWGLVAGVLLVLQLTPILKGQANKITDYFLGERSDKRESSQAIAQAEIDMEKAKVLADLGNQSFTEEQVTRLTSELQVEVSKWSEFFRKELIAILGQKFNVVEKRLDQIIVLLGQIDDDLSERHHG